MKNDKIQDKNVITDTRYAICDTLMADNLHLKKIFPEMKS